SSSVASAAKNVGLLLRPDSYQVSFARRGVAQPETGTALTAQLRSEFVADSPAMSLKSLGNPEEITGGHAIIRIKGPKTLSMKLFVCSTGLTHTHHLTCGHRRK